MKKEKIKILLVGDHKLVLQGIKSLLSDVTHIEVTGEFFNIPQSAQQLSHKEPDVVLLDLSEPVTSSVERAKKIRQIFSPAKVVMLSAHEGDLPHIVEAGADGYLLKQSSKDELVFAINKVVDNGIYISSEFAMNILAKQKPPCDIAQKTPLSLSEREKEVLYLIADGLTNTQMAQKLFTSVRTIETRRKKLLTKTGTTNTATLIKFAVKNGLIK